MNRFIWDLQQVKKIKTKEIREYVIRKKENTGLFVVEVYGFFGGGVEIFEGSLENCRNHIDEMTANGRTKESTEKPVGEITDNQ